MKMSVDPSELYRIIYTDHPNPFDVLGAHPVTLHGEAALAVRAFLPEASEAYVLERGSEGVSRHRMALLHPYGFFELILPGRSRESFRYELERIDEFGRRERFLDSYAFEPSLTDFDLYLFGQGRNYQMHEKLGAHRVVIAGVEGIQFAVWAPRARSVSVIGSFNGWDRRRHAMRRLACGVWEIFVPGLDEGALYKFQLKTRHDFILDKADPYATRSQMAPRTASIVHSLGRHQWADGDWMASRGTRRWREQPMSIYEVHLASWQRRWDPILREERPLSYRDLIDTLVPYVQALGFTHVEFLPVMEHPFGGSWGYQVTGYFAPYSKLGRPEDLMALIDAFHQVGIGVILDWVPAHFPKDIHALGRFDGTPVFEHHDPRRGEHQDWGTYIFNFGLNEVKNFLIGSALHWIENYHADGLRVDAITSMLYLNYSRGPGEWAPNKFGGVENLEAVEFLHELNLTVHQRHPGTFVCAEESTSWPGVTRAKHLGGLEFDFKWNMGWMNDTLAYMQTDPINRKFMHQKLTFSIWYAFNEAFILPLSHDEVVHLKKSLVSKMPGDAWKQRANHRLLLGYQYGHPGKKLLFMGAELGQKREWNHDRALDWFMLEDPAHLGIQRFLTALNALYRAEPALWERDGSSKGFEWIDFADSNRSIIAFMRKGRNPRTDTLIFVYNFTPVPRHGYRIGVPRPGVYREVLNSDAAEYGGSGVGNYGQVTSVSEPIHERAQGLVLSLPPLGLLVLKRQVPNGEAEEPPEEDEPLSGVSGPVAGVPGVGAEGPVASVVEVAVSQTSEGARVEPVSEDLSDAALVDAGVAAMLTLEGPDDDASDVPGEAPGDVLGDVLGEVPLEAARRVAVV